MGSEFCQAIAHLPNLKPEDCQNGLQAIKSCDKEKLKVSDPKLLAGSICLDDALKDSHPNASRWDYGVAIRKENKVITVWFEVHPAKPDQVKNMIKKAEWLNSILKLNQSLNSMSDRPFRWIATGSVSITKSGSAYRKLSIKGISFPQKILIL